MFLLFGVIFLPGAPDRGLPRAPSGPREASNALLLRASGRCAKYVVETLPREQHEAGYQVCMEGGGYKCFRRTDGVLDCGEEAATRR